MLFQNLDMILHDNCNAQKNFHFYKYQTDKPLKGAKIAGSLHMTIQTLIFYYCYLCVENGMELLWEGKAKKLNGFFLKN